MVMFCEKSRADDQAKGALRSNGVTFFGNISKQPSIKPRHIASSFYLQINPSLCTYIKNHCLSKSAECCHHGRNAWSYHSNSGTHQNEAEWTINLTYNDNWRHFFPLSLALQASSEDRGGCFWVFSFLEYLFPWLSLLFPPEPPFVA